jgi:beta-galactosidase
MEKILQGDKITLGVCYYPEHWESGLWKNDLYRMQEAGIKAVRIAEFAWSKFEMTEGVFCFDFFDAFMETASAAEMSVIFGTPTATPPAWLTEQYPEVLNRRMDGVLYRHGNRRHYNYNSPVYRRFTERIVTKLGEHYGKHPAIIGWQIDNEINCQIDEFYSESDTIEFREFLKNHYGTLEALNDAWGTVFWNQTYTDWAQVRLPMTIEDNSANPHHSLDYIRFVSESARSYVKLQSDILRSYIKPGDFITTNGIFSNLDNHTMNRESLDFFTYDSYPNFAHSLDNKQLDSPVFDLKDRAWSRRLAETRSVSPKFGIMEQQSGANGWNSRMETPSPRPGQMTLWTMQSIAHGADYVSYFRWRTCTMGTEIYWHGILDYSNRDNMRYAEVKDIHKKIEALAPVAGAEYKAAFAVLRDYDNIWDARIDVWHKRIESESEAGIFEASVLTHTPMDYVYFTPDLRVEDLAKYPLLIYPHGIILSPERVELLESYVEQGGTLLLGCRTGYKDIHGKCPMHKLPGLLQKLSGADVVEHTFVAPDEGKVTVNWDGTVFEAPVFNDILEALGSAKIVGTYTNSYYAGKGALVSNSFGRGTVYYFGGTFNRETAAIFLTKLKFANPYGDNIEAPSDCEIAVRGKGDKQYLFVLNYSREARTVTLKKLMTDLYSGKTLTGAVEMPPYGTAVYTAG